MHEIFFLSLFVSYVILANKLGVELFDFYSNSLMGVFVGDLALAVILYIVGVIKIVKSVNNCVNEL